MASRATFSISAGLVTSSAKARAASGYLVSKSCTFARSRAVAATCSPHLSSSSASNRPKPVEAPVINQVLPEFAIFHSFAPMGASGLDARGRHGMRDRQAPETAPFDNPSSQHEILVATNISDAHQRK